MNLLFTLDRNYLKYLASLLRSICDSNKEPIEAYIISNDLAEEDLNDLSLQHENVHYNLVSIDEKSFNLAKVSKRYPLPVYYRIFAAQILPDKLDRILYLDPDIIVLKSLEHLYQMDFEGNYFIAASNIKEFLRKLNEIKNHAPKNAFYPNTGVLLINLELLRREQNVNEVYDYIEKYNNYLLLPDQDIIQGLYGNKIKGINPLEYNLGDRGIEFYNLRNMDKIDIEWVKKNTTIIHYYGKNKPWKPNYRGILKEFYDYYK